MDAAQRKQIDKLMISKIDIIAGKINSYVEGRESGLVEGLEKGREEGARITAEKNARAFLRLGVPAETVAKGTWLSLKEIQELAYEHDNR